MALYVAGFSLFDSKIICEVCDAVCGLRSLRVLFPMRKSAFLLHNKNERGVRKHDGAQSQNKIKYQRLAYKQAPLRPATVHSNDIVVPL